MGAFAWERAGVAGGSREGRDKIADLDQPRGEDPAR